MKNVFQVKDMEFVNVSLPWMPERHAMVPTIVEKEFRTEQVRCYFPPKSQLCINTRIPILTMI